MRVDTSNSCRINNYNLRNRHNISQTDYHHTKTHIFHRLEGHGIPLIQILERFHPISHSRKGSNLNILEIRKYHVVTGDRYFNVLQSRLRNRYSALNSDLYCANLIPNALCLCGKSDETAKHCLLHCKIILYQEIHFLLEFKELIMIY